MPKIDKGKLPNYILCAIVVLAAFAVMQKLAYGLWRIDLARTKHLYALGRMAANGKLFASVKYISFVVTMLGSVIAAAGLGSLALEADLSPFLGEKKSVPEPEAKEGAKTEPKPAPAPEPTIPLYPTHNHSSNTYNQAAIAPLPTPPAAVRAAEAIQAPAMLPSAGDIAEKEALQKKIQEIMGKMKEKEEADAAPSAPADARPAQPGRILERKFSSNTPKAAARMNFADIPVEANSEFERALISAGTKLLSEIRIGPTGIDYIAASDAINIIQAFAPGGAWMASEEGINGTPVWFSEDGNAASPVARAIEAKRAVEELIKGRIDLPVRAYACMASGTVLNALDMEAEWARLGVKVLRLDSDMAEPGLDALSAEFPPSSQPELPEERMQELISILEKAEAPA